MTEEIKQSKCESCHEEKNDSGECQYNNRMWKSCEDYSKWWIREVINDRGNAS